MEKVFSLGVLSFRFLFILELIESVKLGKCLFFIFNFFLCFSKTYDDDHWIDYHSTNRCTKMN